MKVLVVGGGGREHALVWKIKQSKHVKQVYCVPGNPGIAQDAICENIPVSDIRGILNFATKNKIDLTVVGPEAPLVQGIVDLFDANGIPVFGPSERASELEGSKAFAKYLMDKYHIPTADFQTFTDYEKAVKYVKSVSLPVVLKADGLAAGKGVIICEDREKALAALDQIMVKKAFGAAGQKVVVEEFLEGQEVSLIGISDGENLVYLVPSQDHKRIFDNDQGPNSGGMGAYAPVPFIDANMMQRIKSEIMQPTIKGMALEERPFKGVLYAGLILTASGPKVLEYNCRFGDPETQVILPLAKSDIIEALMAAREGYLDRQVWENHNKFGACIVISSGGYPGAYQKGKTILGLNNALEKDVAVFHAGTALQEDKVVTAGGRVLGVTAIDDNPRKAIDKAYRAVGKITFDGAYYRRDIGAKAFLK